MMHALCIVDPPWAPYNLTGTYNGTAVNLTWVDGSVAETGFDPQATADYYSSTVERAIFEPLFGYDYLERPYKRVPVTAAAMPDISADGKTVTASFNSGSGVLTLAGTASVADYQQALRNVEFSTSVNATSSRTLAWSVDDGNSAHGKSAPARVDNLRDLLGTIARYERRCWEEAAVLKGTSLAEAMARVRSIM